MSFSRGVRTSAEVVVGQTTAAAMTSRYRGAGFTAAQRFDHTFGRTFVTVTRRSRANVPRLRDVPQNTECSQKLEQNPWMFYTQTAPADQVPLK